jgi:hypothetical protein
MLESDAAFAPVFNAFRGKTLDALDSVPGLVFRNPTVVSIEASGSSVTGVLHRAEASADGVALVADPQSRLAMARGLG